MKKRILSAALAVVLVFALLPFGALALDGPGCFGYLKDYALSNGTIGGGAYSCTAQTDDGTITLSYVPAEDALVLRFDSAVESGGYTAELTVPSSLEMPYAASQTLTMDDYSLRNEAPIPSDFTSESVLDISGTTYEDSNQLFVLGVIFILTDTQLSFLQDTDYTFADLGFAALQADLSGKPVIAEDPQDVSGRVGETAVFSVLAYGSDLTYRWQYQKAGKTEWYDSGLPGHDTAALTVQVVAARDGQHYRCVVTDGEGNAVTSGAAALTLAASALRIVSQPESVSAAIGETARFTVAAEGEDLTYRWQYQKPGKTGWYDSGLQGHDTATLVVPVVAARDGQSYRCVVSDASGASLTSEAAGLTVAAPALVIVAQPENVTAAVGATARFTVDVTGSGLTYRWQYQKPGKTGWYDSGLEGHDSATLIVPVTAARAGQSYRCVISDAAGNTLTSEAASLTIAASVRIVSQPESVTAAVGETAQFTVAAEGEGLTYRWQYQKPGKTGWFDSGLEGHDAATLVVPVTAARGGQSYRCVVTDAAGDSVTSAAASLTIG